MKYAREKLLKMSEMILTEMLYHFRYS